MREKVQEVVWRRVVSDYTARVAAFEQQSAPLKLQVRGEYQKLRALLDRVRASRDAAEVEKAELEFRHAVGELDEAELEAALRHSVDALEQTRTDLDRDRSASGAVRFGVRFGRELEQPATAKSPVFAPPEAVSPIAAPAPPAAVNQTLGAAPADEADATRMVSADILAAAADAPLPSEGPRSGQTLRVPAAGLLITAEGTAPREYRLVSMAYLGRSDENQVQISRPGVSRQHALISASAGGFGIKDLHSQNGTFVNGERITEQPLKDGDQIVVGDTTIVFRTPWPARGWPASGDENPIDAEWRCGHRRSRRPHRHACRQGIRRLHRRVVQRRGPRAGRRLLEGRTDHERGDPGAGDDRPAAAARRRRTGVVPALRTIARRARDLRPAQRVPHHGARVPTPSRN